MYALIDCNNFYASCERLFRPDLQGKPIVVLSNNDGCVIARSNESKSLGIKMGDPYFMIKAACKKYNIAVFSSNYTLYGDLSQRVMTIIEEAWPNVEIYSIDEAFLDLTSMPESVLETFCTHLQKHILKSTGIPTCIGIGPTKTLAKLANYLCKKVVKKPVFNVSHQREWLKEVAVGDIWGVGRQWEKQLVSQGIATAHDLVMMNAQHLKKQFNVVLQRTVMELQGIPCAGLELGKPQKNIMSSKSFGEMQTTWDSLSQALSSHCARACEKLRGQKLMTQFLYVFVQTNRFRDDLAQYNQSMTIKMINPTDDVRIITHYAKRCLAKIFKPGFYYKKIGVCLEDLRANTQQQLDLFHQPAEGVLLKATNLMTTLDAINHKFGRHTIKLAAEGYNQPWAMRAELKSPAYTTSWTCLPKIRNGT